MKYVCKPILAGEISLAFDNKTPNTDMIHEVMDDEILAKRKGSGHRTGFTSGRCRSRGDLLRRFGLGSGVSGGDYSVA